MWFVVLALAPAFAGTWKPTALLQNTFVVASPPEAPVLAVNSAGHAVAVWNATGPVKFSERVAGGGWTAGAKVKPAAMGSGPVAVGIGSDETVAVAWVTVATEFVPADLKVSVRGPVGVFAVPVRVADGTGVWWFDLGVAGDGTVDLVWQDSAGIEFSALPVGGAWSAPLLLSDPGAGATMPDLAVDDLGDVVVAWTQGAGMDVGTAYLPAGGAWEAPTVLAGTGVWNARVGLDAAGDAAVGYLDGYAATVATRPATGPWSAPAVISGLADAYATSFAMSEQGDLLLAWQELDPASNLGRVWAASAAAGGVWSAPVKLSTNAEDAGWPTVAYSGDGTVAAVTWVDNVLVLARAAVGVPGLPWTKATLGGASWGSFVPVGAGNAVVATAWATQLKANPNSARILGRANQ